MRNRTHLWYEILTLAHDATSGNISIQELRKSLTHRKSSADQRNISVCSYNLCKAGHLECVDTTRGHRVYRILPKGAQALQEKLEHYRLLLAPPEKAKPKTPRTSQATIREQLEKVHRARVTHLNKLPIGSFSWACRALHLAALPDSVNTEQTVGDLQMC